MSMQVLLLHNFTVLEKTFYKVCSIQNGLAMHKELKLVIS